MNRILPLLAAMLLGLPSAIKAQNSTNPTTYTMFVRLEEVLRSREQRVEEPRISVVVRPAIPIQSGRWFADSTYSSRPDYVSRLFAADSAVKEVHVGDVRTGGTWIAVYYRMRWALYSQIGAENATKILGVVGDYVPPQGRILPVTMFGRWDETW
jgi:hypothetical protein